MAHTRSTRWRTQDQTLTVCARCGLRGARGCLTLPHLALRQAGQSHHAEAEQGGHLAEDRFAVSQEGDADRAFDDSPSSGAQAVAEAQVALCRHVRAAGAQEVEGVVLLGSPRAAADLVRRRAAQAAPPDYLQGRARPLRASRGRAAAASSIRRRIAERLHSGASAGRLG